MSKSTAEHLSVNIKTLNSDLEWYNAAAVMRVLRPALDIEDFVNRRQQLSNEGYRLLGLYVEEHIVSIASYTISPHATLGRELLIHDMATLPTVQGRGYASRLILKLTELANDHECGRLFVHTRNAQSLYSRGGFEDYSTGMIKKLSE